MNDADTVKHRAVCQLPAIRRSDFFEALRGLQDKGELTLRNIMTALDDTLDQPAYRLGSVCPVAGCKQILDYEERKVGHNSMMPVYTCRDHGEVRYDAYALAVAYPPVGA